VIEKAEEKAMNEADFTVERVARIAASLDLEPELQSDILSANELDEDAWERIEGAHDDALRSALAAGDSSRLEAYDAAYLARIEEERGEISLADYGSIVAAARSGSTASRLAELEIPEAAEMVLVRVFERRRAERNEPIDAALPGDGQ
jgi:hypothetical protein